MGLIAAVLARLFLQTISGDVLALSHRRKRFSCLGSWAPTAANWIRFDFRRVSEN